MGEKDLKSLEETKDLAIDHYKTTIDKFIEDANVNFEIYKDDLMYLNALDIMKAANYAITSLSNYCFTAIRTQSNINLDEMNKYAEIVLKSYTEIHKEVNKAYKQTPKQIADEFIDRFRSEHNRLTKEIDANRGGETTTIPK